MLWATVTRLQTVECKHRVLGCKKITNSQSLWLPWVCPYADSFAMVVCVKVQCLISRCVKFCSSLHLTSPWLVILFSTFKFKLPFDSFSFHFHALSYRPVTIFTTRFAQLCSLSGCDANKTLLNAVISLWFSLFLKEVCHHMAKFYRDYSPMSASLLPVYEVSLWAVVIYDHYHFLAIHFLSLSKNCSRQQTSKKAKNRHCSK